MESKEKKVKFEKPVFYAQNSGAGTFAANCPPNVGLNNSFASGAVTTGTCTAKCRNCATAV